MYGYNIFHEEMIKKLISAAGNRTNNHAYLFVGEEGLGKHEAAQLFANALVCTASHAVPCTLCPACIQAKAKTNPDIIYINKKDKKSIGVETIREINENAYVKPFGTRNKVYIIEDGEIMTTEAQNAFLKTLEEPPEYAVFIILSKTDELLPTILSRCTIVKFPRVSKSVLYTYIDKKYPEEAERRDFLVSFAEGNPGKIDRYITDSDYRHIREESVKKIRELLSTNISNIYTIVDFLEENKDNLYDILDFWIILVRDILFSANSIDSSIINRDIIQFLNNMAAIHDSEYLLNAANVLKTAHKMNKQYVNVRALSIFIALKIKKH